PAQHGARHRCVRRAKRSPRGGRGDGTPTRFRVLIFHHRVRKPRPWRPSVRSVVQPPRDDFRERRTGGEDVSGPPPAERVRPALTASSSSRACARLTALSGSPPSMRAISVTRPSPLSTVTSAVVTPPFPPAAALLLTRMW